ncbi:uncharacterized protein JCM10292_007733 [Rhodotorula paludigena]|uniref:uncharacterized protein n=1 Tax=Rhodotorula paludigena TaxID=86838 RepID=UPI00317F35AA
MQHSETALRVFLANLALPTPSTRAAEHLLDWLNTTASPDRHYLFFCRPDGALRCDRPWERWFERALSDEGATRRDLDEWERETLQVEHWEP